MAHSQKPNILFVFSDQQRWDSLGCYGQKLPVTPHLDQLASEGVRFQHAFSNQPLCTPARSCIQSGKYATETGCWMLDIALPLDEKTIAHYLTEEGYDTAYIGKWHLASTNARYADPGKRPGQQEAVMYMDKPVPAERRGGYDYWLAADVMEFTSHGYDGYLYDSENRKVEFPAGRYRVDAQTDFAIDYLRTRADAKGSDKEKKPFFLFLSYIEPHWQNDTSRHESPHEMAELFRQYEEPGDLVGTPDEASWLTDGWRKEYAHYLACCHSLDQGIGRIRQELKELGLADNTIIVYTSDHGCHFGTRNRGGKDTCHDASIRIPMLIAGPGFEGGRVVSEQVSLIDLPPTLLTAAGASVPSDMKGKPLQQLAQGESEGWLDEVFYQLSPLVIGRGIRTPRWKYAVRAPGKQGWDEPTSDVYVEDFLYDLEKDPHERVNLVLDPQFEEIRAQLAERLNKRMELAGEPAPVIMPAHSAEESEV